MISATASKKKIGHGKPTKAEHPDDTFKDRLEKRQAARKASLKIFLSEDAQYSEERKKLFVHFAKYVMRALSLRENYKIYIVTDRRKYGIKTTADFLNGDNSMYIYCKGRAFVDVLRSIAHEFVHGKQHEFGLKFGHHFLHFDNELEDEANKFAGELVNAYSEVMGHDKIYEN